MNKEKIQTSFNEKVNQNYSEFSKYFEFRTYVFNELDKIIFEINKCLVLELNRAAITLTNNLVERLLKLTLMFSEVGIEGIPLEKWNETFEGPNKKYGSINFGTSIELCKKKKLINQEEKDHLFKIIRVLMRNGFSHADPKDILSDLPDSSVMLKGNFATPNKLEEVNMNQKIIPVFQSILIEEFAKQSAQPYFDFVFNLLFRIEKRLKEKFK